MNPKLQAFTDELGGRSNSETPCGRVRGAAAAGAVAAVKLGRFRLRQCSDLYMIADCRDSSCSHEQAVEPGVWWQELLRCLEKLDIVQARHVLAFIWACSRVFQNPFTQHA